MMPFFRPCWGDRLTGFRGDKDRDYSPQGQIRLAGVLLEELVAFSGTWTGPWVEERKQVCFRSSSFASPPSLTRACQSVQCLRDVCQSLGKLPASMAEVNAWDVSVLTWDPNVHPWFPFIQSSQ